MSNETQKADQIAFHFYTKLFYVVNDARTTSDPRSQPRVDKWFNLETPDSDLFTKEAREPFKAISQAPPPGPPPLEIQVLLSIPELTHNQVLVYLAPDSSRIRIEPTPRFILLESWVLSFSARRPGRNDSTDVALPTIYKHGIPLFRSLFSLLRVLPTWKLYKRLKRRTGGVVRNGHLGIQLRIRSNTDSETSESVLQFHTAPSPTFTLPLSTETHTFPAVPHPLGSLSLTTTYLSTPNFQLDELESLLSSRFISLDLDAGEGFIPTLIKNQQRDSMISGSSLPTSRSILSRSPPRGMHGRSESDSSSVAERFILPSRVTHGTSDNNNSNSGTDTSPVAASGTGTRPIPGRPSAGIISAPIMNALPPPTGPVMARLRKESLNSSPSSSPSTRDLPSVPIPNQSSSSLSSSPASGPLPIRRPGINPVHPFKSNTLSSASGSPSPSIRQGTLGGASPLSTTSIPGAGSVHVRQQHSSISPSNLRPPSTSITNRPSPPTIFAPSSLGDRRTSTSAGGSPVSIERDRRVSLTNVASGGAGEGQDERHYAVPARKRYSSSFGHRYAGSAGSAGSATAAASAGGGNGNAGDFVGSAGSGYGVVASVSMGLDKRERKHSAVGSVASFLSTKTDDDDISIFVQDIDSAKPLSSRFKEKERKQERESGKATGTNTIGRRNTYSPESRWDKEKAWEKCGDGEGKTQGKGQGHDRYRTEDESGIEGDNDGEEEKESDPEAPLPNPSNNSPSGIHRGVVGHLSSLSSNTSKLPTSTAISESIQTSGGPMLTNPDEVEERLRRMNEMFMKTLEGISGGAGGSVRRKEREWTRRRTGSNGGTSSTTTATPAPTAPTAGVTRLHAETGNISTAARTTDSPSPSPIPASLRLGLGLGLGSQQGNSSRSTLAHSEVGMSQGSQEVIGKMDIEGYGTRQSFARR